MTIRLIDVGEEANDETGDTLRDGGIIINENFAELDTRTAAAQTKAEQGVADAAAAKAKADAAVPSAALGVSVAQLVSGKVPVPQLPEFVEPVAGKGLSSNDFTTTEKTKLSTLVNPASYGVGGPAPFIDNIYQIKDGGITYWNQSTTGRPPSGGQGNLISMTGGANGSASTFLATSLDEDKVFFGRVNGATRPPWKQFLLAGDQGIGGAAIPVPEGDCNKAVIAGNYRTVPTTVNGRNVYGVLEVFDYGDNGNSKIQHLTATFGHPVGEIMWFRTGTDQGTRWSPWQRLIAAGNFGLGADPRTGDPSNAIVYISNISQVQPSGKYRISPATVDGPGFYGTLDMSWYDATNWTMTATSTDARYVAVKGCVNGAVQPWTGLTAETITNANGTATKFPDGTLICRWSASARDSASNPQGPLFISTARFQTFAVPFVGETPTVSPASSDPNNAHCWGVVTSASELTRVQVAVMSAASNGQARPGYIAVGRWR
ncbi:hypothetical protein [Pseudomonas protegens]|uniref:hypothetical protein n=1 Tax=Pseudomonas protegens TaxID=380021 RepID=UPI001F44A96E|nr:hypothetical protein [Pseudomonas protegens]